MTTETQQLTTHLVAKMPAYTARIENHLNRRHIIVPVVMMVPGVHNGSRGPLYHPAEELEASAKRWDGFPVTISHPMDEEGNFISAQAAGSRVVGSIHNSRFEDGKLKAEAWIDEQRLLALSTDAFAAIQSGHPLDVSIGAYTDEVQEAGTWNGESYVGIAKNHRPDHLALLPGEQGACSWADGCGIRVNKAANENINSVTTNTKGGSNAMTDEKDILATIKQLSTEGYVVNLITNATGFQETMRIIQQKLDSMDSEGKSHYLHEVYDDYVIYELGKRTPNDTHERTLYKQSYEIQDNGAVELTGNPVEVRRKVEYVTLSMQRTKFNSNNVEPKNDGGQEMADNKPSPCLVAKVDALINHSATRFGEADRDWLLAQSEDVLAKLAPVDQTKTEAPQVNVEQALAVLKATYKKPEEFLAVLPDDLKVQVEEGLTLYRENRDKLIQSIKEASKEWTDEDLAGMSVNMLNKIAKSITPVTDYSALGSNATAGTNGGEEVMLPTGIEMKK